MDRVTTMDKANKLGFKLELRGKSKTWVVAEDEGGIRPATNPEVALWKALHRLQAKLIPSTCSSSGLTIDQLEEIFQVKVDNEALRLTVAALKALLDTHRIPYTLQEEASP